MTGLMDVFVNALVMAAVALVAATVLILLASAVIGPRVNRAAGSRPGELGDPAQDAPWAAPWEAR